MRCEVLETLYVKANGIVPCHDDAGEEVELTTIAELIVDAQAALGYERFRHIERSFTDQTVPWPGTCERCALLRRDEPVRPVDRSIIATLQIEPTLACTLACPGCSNRAQRATRSGPLALSPELYAALLSQLRSQAIDVEWIEYCGQGEPTLHPQFHQFVSSARTLMPATKQRVITNGNASWHRVFRSGSVDEVIVSCDGAAPPSYSQYRVGGDFDAAVQFMADGASRTGSERPTIVWKYILFEWNDSDEELQSAALLAQQLGVDALLFVFTHSAGRSQRFTQTNVEALRSIAPFATVNATPLLMAESDANVLLQARPIPSTVGPLSATALGSLDVVELIGDGAILRGWGCPASGHAPRQLTASIRGGPEASTTTFHLRRDVNAALPHVDPRCGFALHLQHRVEPGEDLLLRYQSGEETCDVTMRIVHNNGDVG